MPMLLRCCEILLRGLQGIGSGSPDCVSQGPSLVFRAALGTGLITFGGETSLVQLCKVGARVFHFWRGSCKFCDGGRDGCAAGCGGEESVRSGFQLSIVKSAKAFPNGGVKAAFPRLFTKCSSVAEQKGADSSLADIEADGRVFNFAAGPATLPAKVVKQAQEELFNWRDSGMSVMEMSHRGKEFTAIIQKAEKDFRELLKVPDNYAVLFLQGGASTQFSAIPLNLAGPEDVSDCIVTGPWSDKAFKEAKKYCKANLVWSGKSEKYTRLPSALEEKLSPGAKFVHICANETVQGVEFQDYPEEDGDTVLVAVVSSNFCSKPIDVSKFGVIFGGVQKNIGPAGVAIAIVRKDLLGKAQAQTPVMLDFKTHADNDSLYNTPPCFTIYVCGLVFEDLLAQGGLEAVEKRNIEKAQLLYDAIDGSNGFYKCPVEKSVRSCMNVPFTMGTPELEAAFLKEAGAQGMVQLKGHRSVGGVRASIYNAMRRAGVEKLVSLMKSFQAKNSS